MTKIYKLESKPIEKTGMGRLVELKNETKLSTLIEKYIELPKNDCQPLTNAKTKKKKNAKIEEAFGSRAIASGV
jgi:hypothetical protein